MPPLCRTLVLPGARAAAVAEDPYPVRWTGEQAVVTLPERIGTSDSGQVRELLLQLVDRGAAVLIADMTGTVSCDHGGADALLRAYQRASGNGTQLRVAVAAQGVRRVLDAAGLDRLVMIYPSVQAAAADGAPAGVIPLVPRPAGQRDDDPVSSGRAARPARWRTARQRDDSPPAGITPSVLWGLVNALADGVVLADAAGVLVLANRRAEELFGYACGELTGQRVESLVPASLRSAHQSHRTGYAAEPSARLMGARTRLAGLRQDGTTFPARISLHPVPTATGRLTMAVIRDISDEQPPADLAELARAAAAARDAHRARELLDRMVNGLFGVGLSLQSTADLPDEIAVQQIADSLQHVDDIIREVRDYAFADLDRDGPPGHAPPGGSR